MSTLEKKFEWFLEHKAEIAAFRNYVRDVERRLPTIIFQWATSNVRQSILTFPKTVDGIDFSDIQVERDSWATWWFKRSHYNLEGSGAYFHLFVPDGADWLEEGSETSAYIGFVLNYDQDTDGIIRVVRQKITNLPVGVSQVMERDDDGAIQIYKYNLHHIFTLSKLAKSESAAREFDDAIKEFTVAVYRGAALLPELS